MENVSAIAIPQAALRKLEFLAGEYSGSQTLHPPGGKSVTYDAFCTVSREACERFVKIEFYAEPPGMPVESFTTFITFSSRQSCYRMWQFSSSSEEPLQMEGNFKGNELVLISDPWSMPWGLQRLRGTFTPTDGGNFSYVAELWDPDGYNLFRETVLRRVIPEGGR